MQTWSHRMFQEYKKIGCIPQYLSPKLSWISLLCQAGPDSKSFLLMPSREAACRKKMQYLLWHVVLGLKGRLRIRKHITLPFQGNNTYMCDMTWIYDERNGLKILTFVRINYAFWQLQGNHYTEKLRKCKKKLLSFSQGHPWFSQKTIYWKSRFFLLPISFKGGEYLRFENHFLQIFWMDPSFTM